MKIPLMSIPGGYYVSMKADGTRYFLYFSTSGVYLINPLNSILTKIAGPDTPYGRFFNILPGTVLDVEIIGEIRSDGTLDKYHVLVFDVLSVSGTDVRKLTYTERLTHIKDIERYLKDEAKITLQVNKNMESKEGIKDLGKPWDSVFKIRAKPVWRLPSPTTLQFEPGESEHSKHFKRKALAESFFKIIGTVARDSIYSNADSVLQELGMRSDLIYRNTDGIQWTTDGIILTPADRPYLENSDVFNQNTRGTFSLVRKWKPIMTIDFKVGRDDSGTLAILSNVPKEPLPKPFYSMYPPWNGNAELNESMIGKVIEFRWGYSTVFLDYAFIPVRERMDKPNPNKLQVAWNVWKLINNPITLDELSGKTLNNMRRYHNRVKRSLLNELSGKFIGDPVLLDLGSGRGGDMLGWEKFSKVYAVEPDMENLRELISRNKQISSVDYEAIPENSSHDENTMNHYSTVRDLHNRSKFSAKSTLPASKLIVINTRAEDVYNIKDKISENYVDCVTIFNALTFFYDSLEHFRQLINTITTTLKVGGYCYMIAFDGELLNNSMKKPSDQTDLDGHELYNSISTENITISKVADPSCRKIWIEISGGIVRGQYEYLINTREVTQLMDLYGFRLIEERYLNEETLLSEEEYWFSSMFKVLKFHYFSSPYKRELNKDFSEFKEKMESNLGIPPLEPSDSPQIIKSTALSSIGITNLLRYGNPQDGSCYVHGMLRAFSKLYKNKTVAEKKAFVIALRKEMSNNYTKEIHESVGGGFFASSELPAYSWSNVKESIGRMDSWVSDSIMGFIGDQLNANVYILRGPDADIYIYGDAASHIKPGRRNVVLYWINDNHYETVGQLEEDNMVRMVSPDDHPLIKAFKK
jgi:hypothetical protein